MNDRLQTCIDSIIPGMVRLALAVENPIARCVYVLKSRGMAHSNQLREFVLTDKGIKLRPVYVGPGGVLTGSSRVSQESRDGAAEVQQQQERELKRLEAERRRLTLRAQLAVLQAELEAVETDERLFTRENRKREEQGEIDRNLLAKSRGCKEEEAR